VLAGMQRRPGNERGLRDLTTKVVCRVYYYGPTMSSSEEEKDELLAEQADEHALEIEAFLSSDDLPEPRRIPFGLTFKSTSSVVTNVASAVGLVSLSSPTPRLH